VQVNSLLAAYGVSRESVKSLSENRLGAMPSLAPASVGMLKYRQAHAYPLATQA
jgi:hypothetical protein